jgi:predicted  nucleic acid-binding Zn-ribbon protein
MEAVMTERSLTEVERENAYLKLRVAQLESDLTDVSAENGRLREDRERTHNRRIANPPNPLGGGQPS